jgi:hypothetical protein
MRTNPATLFSRRALLAGFVVVPLTAALASCGSKDIETADTTASVPATAPSTTAPGTTAPETTEPPTTVVDGTVDWPRDPDLAVIRLEYMGGFLPPGADFGSVPTLVIGGDGRVYREGAHTMEFPGPLVLPIAVRTITDQGVTQLLAAAADAGLLGAAPDYTGAENVADAPDTVLTITTTNGTFVHRAYGLGLGGSSDGVESSPARRTLQEYVAALQDLEATVGAGALGEETLLTPETYRVRSLEVDQAGVDAMDPKPAVVPWPDSAGLALHDAADCATITADAIGSLFDESKSNTVFTEGDGETPSLYQLAVRVQLPGDPAC